jgi:hypothetical protein
MFRLFRPKLETRLTNATGFPVDVPAGLILVTSDGVKWRVTERVSDTVLVLVPLRWWHHRYAQMIFAGLTGLAVGFAIQWATS